MNEDPYSIENYCPDCGHSKVAHAKDLGCYFCLVLIYQGLQQTTQCKRIFASLISEKDKEDLMKADKEIYHQRDVCSVCLAQWREHHGMLCPNGVTIFKLLIGGRLDA